MNSVTIEHWIKNLGKTHRELIERNIIPESELSELFPGIDELHFRPEIGVEMHFWWETERYENLFITLEKLLPATKKYTGELPSPYSLNMNQASVHALFGKPLYASGPRKSPEPVGQTGGWEEYLLDDSLYPNTKVIFKYLESMDVYQIIFTLIELDHPYP